MNVRVKFNQLFKQDLGVLNGKQNYQFKDCTFCFVQLICQYVTFSLLSIYLHLALLMLTISPYSLHICILNMADMLWTLNSQS